MKPKEEEREMRNVENHFEAGSNCQVFNGNNTGCVFAMPGSSVTQQVAPAAEPKAPVAKSDKTPVPVLMLVTSVAKVRKLFWSDSSMTVIFCVCRDYYDYANNMSQFERDFHCQEGLLSNTFRNNPYMRLPVDKWEQNGAKTRVLRLVEAYHKVVEQQREE